MGGVRARLAWFSICAFAWCAGAPLASAEALPGRFEVYGGGHLILLWGGPCERDLALHKCGEPETLAGFQLGSHVQLVPWLALGARVSGTAELDTISDVNDAGFAVDHERWLWRASLRIRFDPPLWPKAVWFAAEAGAALDVDSIERQDVDQPSLVIEASESNVGFLAGGSIGWDFLAHERWLMGAELQAQLIVLPERVVPRPSTFVRNQPIGPYFSLGLHAGHRW